MLRVKKNNFEQFKFKFCKLPHHPYNNYEKYIYHFIDLFSLLRGVV